MSIKNILFYANGGANFSARAQLALDLAKSHGARLRSVFVVPHPLIPPYVDFEIPAYVMEERDATLQAEAEKLKALFEELTRGQGVAAEWHTETGEPFDLVIRHARYADLLITEQEDPDLPRVMESGFDDKMALDAAIPVMVLPKTLAADAGVARVAIAWNASREASMAVHGALPLLQKASAVNVLTVVAGAADQSAPGPELVRYLASHGVDALASAVDKNGDTTGERLIAQACEWRADLLVAGAYGHARLREFILGGVTRLLTEQSRLPVLLAH